MRRILFAVTGLGVLLVACNPTPDIPNDLQHETYPSAPGNRTRGGSTSDDDPMPESGDDPPPASPASTTSDAGSDGALPAADAGSTTGPAPCSDKTTQASCYQCCDGQVPGGPQKYNQFFNLCVCSGTKCGGYCSQSWCAGFYPNPGDACDQCLGAYADTCDQKATTDCQNDATCKQLLACDSAAGCATKPIK